MNEKLQVTNKPERPGFSFVVQKGTRPNSHVKLKISHPINERKIAGNK